MNSYTLNIFTIPKERTRSRRERKIFAHFEQKNFSLTSKNFMQILLSYISLSLFFVSVAGVQEQSLSERKIGRMNIDKERDKRRRRKEERRNTAFEFELRTSYTYFDIFPIFTQF